MIVNIDLGVVETLVDLASQAHPKETVMILEGSNRKGEIKVTGVLFQQYSANENSTHFNLDLPMGTKSVGTFHSHPGPSNRPSQADLKLFEKFGLVHFIAHYPYRIEDFACYDKMGTRVPFSVSN
ncbi:MAG: Mov34/MPN/PAD-1 family protein [Candidatus Woesearchaeota archaeon]